MKDFNRITHAHAKRSTLSHRQPFQSPTLPQKSSPWVNIALTALLLLAALLTSCRSLAAVSDQTNNDEKPDGSVIEENISLIEPAAETGERSGGEIENARIGDTLAGVDLPPVSGEPEIGEITFALGVTDNYEPINPGFLFAQGIAEIHAVFDYSGMAGKTWERVWYLNEREISRSSDPWTGSDSGVFDYFIDNGGEPLPAGDWILEIYVDGELRSLGVFIIEGNQPE